MQASEYISKQAPERQAILSAIHSIIVKEDSSVLSEIGLMMGKEMILYKERGFFKYGLSSVKNHMSLHIMPIYMSSPLHAKYQKLLPQVEFQKGCINFKCAADVPLDIMEQLFADCAKVDIAAMLEKRKR
jgi:hypothetical protein